MNIRPSFTHNNKDLPVKYIETTEVKEGVSCDVYQFIDDNTKDLAIVSVNKGAQTPLQKVLTGKKTIQGFISGKGKLTINKIISYNFPNHLLNEIEVEIGQTMQWMALEDLVFYEICEPPFKEGRFQSLKTKEE